MEAAQNLIIGYCRAGRLWEIIFSEGSWDQIFLENITIILSTVKFDWPEIPFALEKYVYFTLLHCLKSLFCMKNPQYFERKSANFSLDQATEEGTPPETFCFANILFFFFKCCDNYYTLHIHTVLRNHCAIVY